MNFNSEKGRTPTNNPYLTGFTSNINPTTPLTLGSELKRLGGLPLRLPATLLLVVLPLLLALAGALDLLTEWLYTVSHHVNADPRPAISALDCVLDQTKKLCQSLVWASTVSPRRLVLYPWHNIEPLHRLEPYVFVGFLVLAVLSFTGIGSPNVKRGGQTLLAVVGLKNGSKQTTNQQLGLELKKAADKKAKAKGKGNSEKEEAPPKPPGLIPALELSTDPTSLVEAWQSSLIIGGYMPRLWESDPGYFYLDRQVRPVPYWLTLNMLRTNLVIVAPQGSGKTSSVYRPMLTFMRRSNSAAIFWDSKGDDFNPVFFDYNFDPGDPAHSIKLNIFAGQNPAQAGERLAEALIPDLGGDKQYFSNNAKDALAALTAGHAICFDRNPALVNLLEYLTTPANVQNLHDLVLERLRGPERHEEGLRLATLLRRVMQLAENKSADVLGSLATALSPLVTGPAAKVLVTNPERGAYTIEELLRKPGLIRLSLPIAKSPRIAPILGRLVLAQFTYAVLSPDCNRDIFKLAAVDEARHFITENVASGMAQARSNNAGYVLALQALTQIRDESLLDTIFAVSGTKIVMTGVGEKDARRFSDTFGQLELPYVNHSQGQSKGVSQNNGSSYTRGQEYEFFGGQSGFEARASRGSSQGRGQSSSQNTSSSTVTRVRPRFFPAEIRELNQFQAVIESSDAQGRRWFAQVIDMRASTVNRLEDLVLEQLKRLRNSRKENSQAEKKAGSLTASKETSPGPAEGITNDTATTTEAVLTSPTMANFVKPTVRFMPVTNLPVSQEPEKEQEVNKYEKPINAGIGQGITVSQQQTQPQSVSSGFPPINKSGLPQESASQLQPAGQQKAVLSEIASGQIQSAGEQLIQTSYFPVTGCGSGSENLPDIAEDESATQEKPPLSDKKTTLKVVPSPDTVKDTQGLL